MTWVCNADASYMACSGDAIASMSCTILNLNVLTMHRRVTSSATFAQTRTQCHAKKQHRQWLMLAHQVICFPLATQKARINAAFAHTVTHFRS